MTGRTIRLEWVKEESAMCYADEQITIRRESDSFVLFEGIIRDLKFHFNFAADNVKENNSVKCNIPVFDKCKYYPFHILCASAGECVGQYDRVYEDMSEGIVDEECSQHTFIIENSNGEVLLAAKLLKHAPVDWLDVPNGTKRRRPSYDLLNREKVQGIGYAESIYLHPLKLLIAAGIQSSGDVNLTCDIREWYCPHSHAGD